MAAINKLKIMKRLALWRVNICIPSVDMTNKITNAVPTPEQLQQLKDITLPPQISWWPPAPGWQILIALAMLLILAGLWYYYRYKTHLKRTALQALQSLPPSVYKNSTVLAAEVSALLRRVAIQRYGNQIATLHGTAWRTYLTDKQLPDEIADFLANAPYTQSAQPPAYDKVIQAARQWIQRVA